MNEIDRVECRLRRSMLGAMSVLTTFATLGLACAFLFPDGKADKEVQIMASVFSLLCWCGFIAVWLWTARAYILADENGLRWRNTQKEHFARWNQVTDFYDATGQTSSTRIQSVIETSVGKLTLDNFNNIEALRLAVQQRAVDTPLREWRKEVVKPFGKKLVSSEMLPQTFSYNWWPLALFQGFAICVLSGLSAAWFFGMPASFARDFSQLNLDWKLIVVAVLLYCLIGFTLAGLLAAYCAMALHSYKYAHQRIVLSPDGIHFSSKTRDVEARWEEVTNYFTTSEGFFSLPCYRVQTQGGDFGFTAEIRNLETLRYFICECAKNAAANQWNALVQNKNGGEIQATRFVIEKRATGQRVYHFRSRINRLMLWFFWSIALCPLLMVFIFPTAADMPINIGGQLLLSALGVGFASWMTYVYKHDYIATDANGLMHRTPFGTKFIAWNEVERFGKNDWDFHFVYGKTARIAFYGTLGQLQELLAEIAQSSTRSSTREWHHI